MTVMLLAGVGKGGVMWKAAQKTELIVQLGVDNTASRSILSDLGARGIRIIAHNICPGRTGNALLLVADDLDKAGHTLRDAGYHYKTDEVVLIETDPLPACAARVGLRLRQQGIGVLYSYETTAGGNSRCAVFKTTDNARALHVLISS